MTYIGLSLTTSQILIQVIFNDPQKCIARVVQATESTGHMVDKHASVFQLSVVVIHTSNFKMLPDCLWQARLCATESWLLVDRQNTKLKRGLKGQEKMGSLGATWFKLQCASRPWLKKSPLLSDVPWAKNQPFIHRLWKVHTWVVTSATLYASWM